MRQPMMTYRHPRESGGPEPASGLNGGRLRDSPRERLPVEFASTDAHFTLAPRRPGGKGRVRGADEPVCGAAHLTLPSLRDGPLPLPPEGRRGALFLAIHPSHAPDKHVGGRNKPADASILVERDGCLA